MTRQPLVSEAEILHRAASLAPPDRAAYLDEACGGDAALREEIESLLAAHDASTDFLTIRPDADGAAPFVPVSERPGVMVGRYKLLEQIGEGGFGVVFMAEQKEPVVRKVALKIIKPGMDSRQVVARFEAERQALALMDHPNIARVLDAGVTASGRPYFVMDLVKGIPITDYCDQHRLTIRQRLELMTAVCQAVQHAHQKGIIHRDIKPSNVMVAEYDGRPVPKVIDFGVAKATGGQLTERTLFTHYGQIIGTFEYMSPEQARFNQLDVDTRSDIYSLGVLLYELVAGSTPLEKERLRSAAFDELLRIIGEEEPPRPSTRLSSSQSLSSIAANRSQNSSKLSESLRGELDWIVMKALEKDRGRRYETANALLHDVESYLAGDAVLACPPSASYRFRKFARRNRTVLVTAGLIVASLSLGLIAAVREARRAASAVQVALANEQRAVTGEQRARAEKELKEVALRRLEASTSEAQSAQRDAEASREEARVARDEANIQLSRAVAARGVDMLADGSGIGLLYLLQACQRVDDIPRARKGLAALWAGWNQYHEGRLVDMANSDSPVRSISFDASSGALVTVSESGELAHWDTMSGLRRTASMHLSEADVSALNADGTLVAVVRNRRLLVYDVQAELLLFQVNRDIYAADVAFSPNGELVATIDRGCTAQFWSAANGEPVGQPMSLDVKHEGRRAFGPCSVVFDPSGEVIATSAVMGAVTRLWSVATCEPLGEPLPHTASVLSYSTQGELLAIASGSEISLIAPKTGKQARDKLTSRSDVRVMAFSPNDDRLAVGLADGTIEIWDLASPEPVSHNLGHLDSVTQLQFTPDGKQLVSASHDKTLRLWNPDRFELPRRLLLDDPTWSVAVDAFGRLATGGDDGTLRLWRLYSGELLNEWKLKDRIESLALASTRGLIAAAQCNGPAYQWDTTTGDQFGAPINFEGGIAAVAYSPDENYIATQSELGNVQIWETETGRPTGPAFISPDLGGALGWQVAFSPDGNRLAATHNSKECCDAIILTVPRLEPAVRLPSLSNVHDVLYMPDGNAVVTASSDYTLRFWDATSGKALMPPIKLDDVVRFLAISSDGSIMATGSWGETSMLWETSSMLPLGPPSSHGAFVRDIALSNNGRVLVAATEGGVTFTLLPRLPASLREIELRTWLALGARIDDNAVIAAIQGEELQQLRQELELLKTSGPSSKTADEAHDEYRVRQLWAWCLGPHPGKDFSALLRDAEAFVQENPLDATYCDLLTLGGLSFRAGQFDRATECLNDSIAAFPDVPPYGNCDRIFPQLLLAITMWRHGRREEARELLVRIQPAIDAWSTSPECPWYGRSQIESLRREAEAMILERNDP